MTASPFAKRLAEKIIELYGVPESETSYTAALIDAELAGVLKALIRTTQVWKSKLVDAAIADITPATQKEP